MTPPTDMVTAHSSLISFLLSSRSMTFQVCYFRFLQNPRRHVAFSRNPPPPGVTTSRSDKKAAVHGQNSLLQVYDTVVVLLTPRYASKLGVKCEYHIYRTIVVTNAAAEIAPVRTVVLV